MSSGTVTPPPRPAEPPPRTGPYEASIEDRLRRTRRQLKGVDIAGGLLTLAIGTLAYLLAAAVIDHLVSGGLGHGGRWLLFLALLGGGGCYIAQAVLPAVIHRISPIFAAYTIEQSRPSLKNSLINFLLLRGHRREVPPLVYQAIERRAAADLATVPPTTDLVRIIVLLLVLAVVVLVGSVYLIVSPKNAFVSAGRVILPWADIRPPTRVTIDDVRPGDAALFHGDHVTVSAKVRIHSSPFEMLRRLFRGDNAIGSARGAGVGGETVALYYSTADGRSINQKVPMTPSEDGSRHQCRLPSEELGFQQDVEYYLAGGDYTTPRFRIDVQTAPTILVDTIEYDYPDYTGLADRTVRRQGDIRALEGTEVTIRAAANQEVNWARIDLGCDGRHELKMQTAGKTATGSFVLQLDSKNPTLPEHDSYQLRFEDTGGQPNPQPVRHQIDVIRDLPPEIQLVDPQQEEVPLAEDGRLEIRVRALDPDFALRQVVLRAECGGRNLIIPPMLDTLHQGGFEGAYMFEPARARLEGGPSDPASTGLKAGDRVRYWAEADDNKEPTPGHSVTAQRWITIVRPEAPQPPEEQPKGAGRDGQKGPQEKPSRPPKERPGGGRPPQEEHPEPPAEKPKPAEQQPPEGDGSPQQDRQKGSPNEGSPNEGSPDQQGPGQPAEAPQPKDGSGEPESGTGGPGQQQAPDGQSDEPGQPIDPETQPGDAIEKILKHREQQQKEQGQPQPGEPQPGEKGSGGNQASKPQPGEKGSGGEQVGKPEPGEKGAGGEQPGKPQPGEKGAGGEQAGKPQPGEEGSGGEQSGKPQPGEKGAGGEQTAKPQPGEKGAGGEQTGKPQPGEKGAGGEQVGKPEPGEKGSGGKQETGGPEHPQQGSPGAGESSSEPSGSPSPQGENSDRQKKTGEPGQGPAEKPEPAKSPSISRHQSDSQSETPGDRSGGGREGGGQRSPQQGTGTAGSQTEAEKGGAPGRQQGDGETGSRGGKQVETDQQTGSSAKQRGGPDSGQREQPGGAGPGEKPSEPEGAAGGQRPQQGPRDGGRPGDHSSSGPTARGQGNPTVGGGQGPQPEAGIRPKTTEPGGEDPNLEYARKATDMALEHLKDLMNQDDSELDQDDSRLLDELGGRERARKFLEKWEQMEQAAARKDAEGEAARRRLDQALKSLGLRPRGAQLRGGRTRADQLRNMREAGRFDPPREWSELFRAYTRGVEAAGRE